MIPSAESSDIPVIGARPLDRRAVANLLGGVRLVVELGFWMAVYVHFFRVDASRSWQQLLIWFLPLYVLAERRFADWSLEGKKRTALRGFLTQQRRGIVTILLLVFQIAAVVTVPIPAPDEADSYVAWLWIFLGLFQVRVAVSLTRNHLDQVRRNLNDYLDPEHWFEEKDDRRLRYVTRVEGLRASSKRRYSDLEDRQLEIEAEAQSQIELLLRLYHGILTAGYVVIAYFLVGERFDIKNFVYENNEGFTAALTLLIVVIATVAIQMYQDVAEQIRKASESFERDISLLSISLLGVEHRMERVWSHAIEYLPTVSQLAKEEFQRRERAFRGDAARRIRVSLGLGISEESQDRAHDWTELNSWFRDDLTPSGQGYEASSDDGFNAMLHMRPGDLATIWQQDLPYPYRFHLEFMQRLHESTEMGEVEEGSADQSLPELLERSCHAMNLKAGRYVADSDFSKTITACDNLDIDATYFLDDQHLFKLLLDSADRSDTGLRGSPDKQDVRGQFARKLRFAEYARLVYIGGWLWYVKRQATRDYDDQLLSWLSDVVRQEVEQVISNGINQRRNLKSIYFAKSLENPESALHNLRRAALARQRRQGFSEFERRQDNFLFRRNLAIPIVPRYRDRVRHLQAVFSMSEENQSIVRMPSIHNVLSPEPTEGEIIRNANRLHNDGRIPFSYQAAIQLVEAQRCWKTFLDNLALPGTMRIFPRDVRNLQRTFQRDREELSREQERIERFVLSWYSRFECRQGGAIEQPLRRLNSDRVAPLHRIWAVISKIMDPSASTQTRSRFHSSYNEKLALKMLDFVLPGTEAVVLGHDRNAEVDSPEGQIAKAIEFLMRSENDDLLANLLLGSREVTEEVRAATIREWRSSRVGNDD